MLPLHSPTENSNHPFTTMKGRGQVKQTPLGKMFVTSDCTQCISLFFFCIPLLMGIVYTPIFFRR